MNGPPPNPGPAAPSMTLSRRSDPAPKVFVASTSIVVPFAIVTSTALATTGAAGVPSLLTTNEVDAAPSASVSVTVHALLTGKPASAQSSSGESAAVIGVAAS